MGDTGVDTSTYTAALIQLASQYDNTTEEVKKYNEALLTGNKETIAVAEEALKASTLIGEAADKYGLNADVLEAQAKALQEVYKE